MSVDGKNCIVTELPPGVASNTVQERIRALVESGEMSGVADMSDLTDRRNGLRIVVTAKRGHSAEQIRDQLLALTPLESTFAASLVALDEDRVPRWWIGPRTDRAPSCTCAIRWCCAAASTGWRRSPRAATWWRA